MKCSYCGKEINEMTENFQFFTVDGDVIHDDCKQKWDTKNHFEDLIEYIEGADMDELTEFLKSHDIKFESDDSE